MVQETQQGGSPKQKAAFLENEKMQVSAKTLKKSVVLPSAESTGSSSDAGTGGYESAMGCNRSFSIDSVFVTIQFKHVVIPF